MHRLRDPSASRAWIAGLRPIDVEFVRHAILPCICALVDVSVVANHAEQFLRALFVALFGRADEVIIRDAHPLPKIAKLRRNLVGILLRRFAGGLRGALDLLTVLVGASQEESVS